MQSTVQLFRHLYNNLPPLFPENTKQKMAHALEHLENDPTINLEEVERTMVKFGYEVWPWNEAYKEFLALAETKVGEHFLLPKLSPGLQARFYDFKLYSGTLRDLHAGKAADFFSADERSELCGALVNMQQQLRDYVNRELIGLEKVRYLRRVNEFQKILEEIKKHLSSLRQLADSEQDHPTLADEIRSRVQGFEHGLCLIGPELQYEAVCQSIDFFKGRKQELNRLRGIHVPMEIDFYS